MPVKITPRIKFWALVLGVPGLFAGSWTFHNWLATHMGAHLFTTAAAQTLSNQVQQASNAAKTAAESTQQLAEAFKRHIDGEDLKYARDKVDTLTEQLSSTKLWESANGANEISRARREDLERQLERMRSYVTCLEIGRPNCRL